MYADRIDFIGMENVDISKVKDKKNNNKTFEDTYLDKNDEI